MTPPGFFIVFAGACQANLPCIYTCEMGVEQKNSMAFRRNAANVGILRASFKPAPTGGFPIALRITSFLGMTIEFRNKLQGNHTTNLQEIDRSREPRDAVRGNLILRVMIFSQLCYHFLRSPK
jgi:hypothetical protein